VTGRSATLLGVDDYDKPETIRFKKYATGLQLILQGTGIETGQTPKEIVWAKDKARLYRNEPEKLEQDSVPVLLVYALILRPYILDLVPSNSLVEYLVGEGFDVFLLDWAYPATKTRTYRSNTICWTTCQSCGERS
jgi:polyhydroxyalkanoate synthase